MVGFGPAQAHLRQAAEASRTGNRNTRHSAQLVGGVGREADGQIILRQDGYGRCDIFELDGAQARNFDLIQNAGLFGLRKGKIEDKRRSAQQCGSEEHIHSILLGPEGVPSRPVHGMSHERKAAFRGPAPVPGRRANDGNRQVS